MAVEKLNTLLSNKIVKACASCGVKLDEKSKFAICEECFQNKRFRGKRRASGYGRPSNGDRQRDNRRKLGQKLRGTSTKGGSKRQVDLVVKDQLVIRDPLNLSDKVKPIKNECYKVVFRHFSCPNFRKEVSFSRYYFGFSFIELVDFDFSEPGRSSEIRFSKKSKISEGFWVSR